MASFPPPDPVAAANTPTVRTADPSTGYQFDTTSPQWKTACAPLPSFAALEWPGYATTTIEATVCGKPCVIQPWMGDCQQFLGRTQYPGGIGGEVAVYVRESRSGPLPDISMLPQPAQLMFQAMDFIGGDGLWWPDPDVMPQIEFTLINTLTNSVFLRADQESHYWVNKWMEPNSYAQYVKDMSGQVPSPRQYKMVFTVDGVTREWTPAPNQG